VRWLSLLVMAAGCDGDVSGGPGPDGGRDASGGDRDAGEPRDEDAGTSDAGDRCATVSCGANASCDPATGECACEEGFVREGDACVPRDPGDPSMRTTAEVCDAWRAGHDEMGIPAWTEGASACDAGTLRAAVFTDTLARVNLYRWLAGLEPVVRDPSVDGAMQECAIMMHRNRMLSHDPPSDWQCWGEGGAEMAMRSNIALGYPSPSAAVSGFMLDNGVPSLGHRRWILLPELDDVGIGFAGAGMCLRVVGGARGERTRAWTAYPNEGPAPIALASGRWSFQHSSEDLTSATVRLLDPGGAERPIEFFGATGLSGPPNAIAWQPSGWTPSGGDRVRVEVSGLASGPLSYETELVDCP
jgi:uncharacterized protein YkwD